MQVHPDLMYQRAPLFFQVAAVPSHPALPKMTWAAPLDIQADLMSLQRDCSQMLQLPNTPSE